MLRGLAARIAFDDSDAAAAVSPQDHPENSSLSKAMVVEIYSPTRWAVTTRN